MASMCDHPPQFRQTYFYVQKPTKTSDQTVLHSRTRCRWCQALELQALRRRIKQKIIEQKLATYSEEEIG